MRCAPTHGLRMLGLSSACLLILAASGPGQAAPLKWSGTLSVQLDSMSATASGTGVATVNGSGGGSHLTTLTLGPYHPVGGGFATSISDTQGGTGVTKISATLTGPTGKPYMSGTGVNADIYKGALKLFFLGGGGMPVTVPVTGVVGVSSATVMATGSGGTVVTLQGFGWTTGVATAMSGGATVSSSGFAHGPASSSSTATTSGAIRLVTPVQVTTSLPAPNDELALFVATELHFVPEPSMLMLLGSGVVGLVLLGRHRMRR